MVLGEISLTLEKNTGSRLYPYVQQVSQVNSLKVDGGSWIRVGSKGWVDQPGG